jgi:hypothetical protein
LVVAFLLGINAAAHPFIVAMVAAAGGVAVGFGLFLNFVHKQWPVTRQYFDLDRVRKRLDELEH